ncbi:uncharacterized protein LOC117912725 [Vitis riparia]|uniref:uncharacterized protein LOC117912725 n=1 Tax=Vitis riparia TaxID=96939 RepID=UPI00155AC76E|nr:uncharacterized protein LOC117912725 [Vitis riparia]
MTITVDDLMVHEVEEEDGIGPRTNRSVSYQGQEATANVYSANTSSTTYTNPQAYMAAPSSGDPNNNSWFLDSGATHHITVDNSNLASKNDYNGKEKLVIAGLPLEFSSAVYLINKERLTLNYTSISSSYISYAATACYGNDVSEFPSSNFFASAGEGIWDNGAACGRQYLVRCISAVVPMTCIAGQTIQIKIVDRAVTSVSRPSRNGATMVLSTTAFGAVANASASSINIEFQQV